MTKSLLHSAWSPIYTFLDIHIWMYSLVELSTTIIPAKFLIIGAIHTLMTLLFGLDLWIPGATTDRRVFIVLIFVARSRHEMKKSADTDLSTSSFPSYPSRQEHTDLVMSFGIYVIEEAFAGQTVLERRERISTSTSPLLSLSPFFSTKPKKNLGEGKRRRKKEIGKRKCPI
jgi:hypothetical protein